MKLREALILQAPSLALQRAAADEIALLDNRVALLVDEVERLRRMGFVETGGIPPGTISVFAAGSGVRSAS